MQVFASHILQTIGTIGKEQITSYICFIDIQKNFGNTDETITYSWVPFVFFY